MNEQRAAPVRQGEIYEVQITAVGGKGDGIARVKGFVLFVSGTKQGDSVKVRVTKVLEKVGFAEVVGAADKPAPRPRYQTVSEEELREEEPGEQYEETEDFGEEPKQ